MYVKYNMHTKIIIHRGTYAALPITQLIMQGMQKGIHLCTSLEVDLRLHSDLDPISPNKPEADP